MKKYLNKFWKYINKYIYLIYFTILHTLLVDQYLLLFNNYINFIIFCSKYILFPINDNDNKIYLNKEIENIIKNDIYIHKLFTNYFKKNFFTKDNNEILDKI